MTNTCPCACHVGGAKATHVPPLLTDVPAALTACRGCAPDHVSLHTVTPQADGYTDKGEGPEAL